MQTFKFRPFERFLLNHDLYLTHGFQFLPERRAVIQLHGLLARGAIHEGEDDARRGPLVRDYLLDAFEVENVPAPQLYAWFGPEPTDPTYRAVCVLICILKQEARIVALSRRHGDLACLGDTLGVETGQTLLLSEEAAARMPTRMRLVTVLPDHVLALLPQTNVIKGAFGRPFLLLFIAALVNQLISAKSALFGIQVSLILVTIFTGVVGRYAAPMAKIVIALPAANPVLAHVDSCCRRHHLASIILGIVIDLALSSLHHVSALAPNHI